jgi:hypothetical protein
MSNYALFYELLAQESLSLVPIYVNLCKHEKAKTLYFINSLILFITMVNYAR